MAKYNNYHRPVTHEVICRKTDTVLFAVILDSDSELPMGDCYIQPVGSHIWKCIDNGLYDSVYQCNKCRIKHMESIDIPETKLPGTGCLGVQDND